MDSLYQQVDRIVLIDNASKNIDDVDKAFSSYANITIIKNDKNKGIAYALNQILQFAYRQHYEWYLSMVFILFK